MSDEFRNCLTIEDLCGNKYNYLVKESFLDNDGFNYILDDNYFTVIDECESLPKEINGIKVKYLDYILEDKDSDAIYFYDKYIDMWYPSYYMITDENITNPSYQKIYNDKVYYYITLYENEGEISLLLCGDSVWI